MLPWCIEIETKKNGKTTPNIFFGFEFEDILSYHEHKITHVLRYIK